MTPIGRLPRRREAARRHARERHGVEARVVLHAVYGGGGICPASRLAAALWCLASHSLTLALRRWQDRCSHGAGNSRSGATLPPGPGTAARVIQGYLPCQANPAGRWWGVVMRVMHRIPYASVPSQRRALCSEGPSGRSVGGCIVRPASCHGRVQPSMMSDA